MTLNFRIVWIKIAAAALLVIPGLMMIAAPIIPLFSTAVDAFLDFAYQPWNGAEAVSGSTALLLNAILGGVLIGLGVMIWLVAEHVYRHQIKLGRTLILIPVFSWFICDSAGSVLAGAWFNAVINIGILFLLAAPILWPTKTAQN